MFTAPEQTSLIHFLHLLLRLYFKGCTRGAAVFCWEPSGTQWTNRWPQQDLQITGLYLQYLCKCSELGATTGGCLSFWACCRVTLSVMEGVLIPPLPEGRLDTLHESLYRYLSLLLRSLHVPGFAPSLPVNIPPFSCHQCLCPPSHSLCRPLSSLHFPQCAPPSHGREQVTGVETGALPGSVMQRTDGPLCPFSRNVDRL